MAHHFGNSMSHFLKSRGLLNTALSMFRSGLQSYANKYWTPTMTFDAHYVNKKDLTSESLICRCVHTDHGIREQDHFQFTCF